jgi:hypothetical protein
MVAAYFRRLRLLRRIRLATLAVAFFIPANAQPHGDMNWPAQFTNDTGTPCCTLNAGMGDCVLVPKELAMGLRKGSVLTLEFPAGIRTITINAIHIGREPAICIPGCLFTEAGV